MQTVKCWFTPGIVQQHCAILSRYIPHRSHNIRTEHRALEGGRRSAACRSTRRRRLLTSPADLPLCALHAKHGVRITQQKESMRECARFDARACIGYGEGLVRVQAEDLLAALAASNVCVNVVVARLTRSYHGGRALKAGGRR